MSAPRRSGLSIGAGIYDRELGMYAEVTELLSIQFAVRVTRVGAEYQCPFLVGDETVYFYKDEGTVWCKEERA